MPPASWVFNSFMLNLNLLLFTFTFMLYLNLIFRFYLSYSMSSLCTLYYFFHCLSLHANGTIVWGSTYKTNLNRLVVLQKCIIRVITKSSLDAPSALLFYEHNFLNITNIYMLQIGLFMFSFKNKLLPVGFHDTFLSSSQLHSY